MAEGRTAVLVALIAGGTAMISGALGAGLQGYFSQDQRLREQVRDERSTAFINFLVEGQKHPGQRAAAPRAVRHR